MMDADIRLVKLTRTTMEGKKTLPNDKSWFVADYFDIMEVDVLSLEDPFAEWLGIGGDAADNNVISEQSYTLYCSSNMLMRYEENSEKSYRKNPFDKAGENECLSIIHVYILPEIIARMKMGKDEIRSDAGILLEPFVKDLYDILDLYADKNQNESFIARVYMMLSAGDFAIVIKSRTSDTAYSISTYLRKRMINREEGNCKESGYVIYKTYTLSTIGREITYADQIGDGRRPDRYIVRGSYSNKYWKEQDDVRSFLTELNEKVEELHPLSGRYDFTVRLREEEFCQMMSATEEISQKTENQSARVKCLRHFIDKEYLSGINERYLMDSAEINSKIADCDVISRSVFLSNQASSKSDLIKKNETQINLLIEKHKEIVKKSWNIKAYRKNIQQYLHLLNRQIILCKQINELSDTRIYAKMLIELLNVTLDSVERYMELCSQSETDEWIDALEDNLRKSIVTLDSYAQYIRNNNLQSMQTPNYNIETSMGAEKILIGYSEVLWRFIEFYKSIIKEASMKDYLAVMVPDLSSNKFLNIDVMFSEEESQEKRLIVIGSPTLEEVTDFPTIFPALFHEVAHQFRYESREKRNHAVLKATIQEIMHEISEHISKNLIEKIGGTQSEIYALCTGLEEGLTEQFVLKEENKNDKINDMSLIQLEKYLVDDIDRVFDIWKWKSDLEKRVKDFCLTLRYELDYSDEKMRGWIIKLYQETQINSSEDSDKRSCSQKGSAAVNIEDTINKITEFAFRIAEKCVYRYLNDTDRNEIDLTGGKDIGWELLWNKVCDEDMCAKSREIGRINSTFLKFLDSMDEYEEDCRHSSCFNEPDWNNMATSVKAMEAQLYQHMKRHWEEVGEKSAAVYSMNYYGDDPRTMAGIPDYRHWIHVGRNLGLDHETKASRFSEALETVMNLKNLVTPSFQALYREETADLLMCNVMAMGPAEYVKLVVSLFVPIDNKYEATDIERTLSVLYVQWCYDPDQEKRMALDHYFQICGDIFRELHKNARNLLAAMNIVSKEESPRGEILCGESASEHKESEDIIVENILYLKKCRRQMQEADCDPETIKALAELDNIIRAYELLIELIWRGGFYCDKLHKEQNEVLEDLAEGKKKLTKLCMEAQKNCVVKEIFNAGGVITEYLARSYSPKGMGAGKMADSDCIKNMKTVNEKCIETLLMMYYHNKIRIAQEGR